MPEGLGVSSPLQPFSRFVKVVMSMISAPCHQEMSHEACSPLQAAFSGLQVSWAEQGLSSLLSPQPHWGWSGCLPPRSPPSVLGSFATEAGVSIYGQGPDGHRRVPFIMWCCPPGAARGGAGAMQTAAALIPSLNHL